MIYKELTNEQVSRIANAFYKEHYAQKTNEQNEPVAFFIAGQPGAGKTKAADIADAELLGNYVHLDADEMRLEIPTHGKKYTPEETQKDAGRLVGALRSIAIQEKRNTIEEGTFRDAELTKNSLDNLKNKGYKVEMLAVAASREESIAGVYSRYERQHEKGEGNPRFVNLVFQENAFKGFNNTIKEHEHAFDRVRVVNRAGEFLYDSKTQTQKSAHETLTEGQKDTPEKNIKVLKTWQSVLERAQKRGEKETHITEIKTHQNRVSMYLNLHALRENPLFAKHSAQDLEKAAFCRANYQEKIKAFPNEEREIKLKLFDEKATQPSFIEAYKATLKEEKTLTNTQAQPKNHRNDGHSL